MVETRKMAGSKKIKEQKEAVALALNQREAIAIKKEVTA